MVWFGLTEVDLFHVLCLDFFCFQWSMLIKFRIAARGCQLDIVQCNGLFVRFRAVYQLWLGWVVDLALTLYKDCRIFATNHKSKPISHKQIKSTYQKHQLPDNNGFDAPFHRQIMHLLWRSCNNVHLIALVDVSLDIIDQSFDFDLQLSVDGDDGEEVKMTYNVRPTRKLCLYDYCGIILD